MVTESYKGAEQVMQGHETRDGKMGRYVIRDGVADVCGICNYL